MIVAIHQPQYMPWLGYFYKMDQADVFIHLDTVQFKKNEFQNRNRIKSTNGWHWLTVPVIYSDSKQLIKDVLINGTVRWQHKHQNSLVTSYGKSEYFQDIMSTIKWAFDFEGSWKNLATLNIEVISCLKDLLGITTKEVNASDMKADTKQPDKRIVQLVKELGGDAYLSGPGGKNYMDLGIYEAEGIEVVFSNFNHPQYDQLFEGFQPHMSILDLLFNHGGNSLEMIRKGGKEEK